MSTGQAKTNAVVNNHTAEGFVNSVAKYSVASVLSIGIMGLNIILTGVFLNDTLNAEFSIFSSWTNTLMSIAILGMDKALIRFYYKPPAGLSQNGLFRACFYFSSAVLLLVGAVGSTVLQAPIYRALGFTETAHWAVPLLFINALMYMLARYFNVLYRMEGSISLYTLQSVLMQFFLKLFYFAGLLLGAHNPVNGMVATFAVGFTGFSLVFAFSRRKVLRPQRANFSPAGYKTLLPYGLGVAPTAVLLTANASILNSYLKHTIGDLAGIYTFSVALSNIVTVIQGGFASFWGPYMFANYKTQQERIKRVHDYINLVILGFFCFLVAFEDVAFWLFPNFALAITIFPISMLGAVFTILCETTVYGNEIAKKPILDTLSYAAGLVISLGLSVVLVPRVGLYGAAIGHTAGNFAMFLLRTFTGQHFYRSINKPAKTALAVALAIGLTVLGTLFAQSFIPKLLASAAFALVYCLMYRAELRRLLQLAKEMLGQLMQRLRKNS